MTLFVSSSLLQAFFEHDAERPAFVPFKKSAVDLEEPA
jgi:hypothetical protein